MLFLVIGEGLDAFPPQDMMQQLPDLLLASFEMIEEAREEGKVKFFGSYATGDGGILVYEGDSVEEVSDFVTSLPAYPFSSWEIKPLVSGEKAVEQTKRVRELLAK